MSKRETFAIVSRIDYGSPGFRVWLLEHLQHICALESPKFTVVQGGLVSAPHLLGTLVDEKGEKRKKAHAELVNESARDLAKLLPELHNAQGDRTKYYLFTSPATNYDSKVGIAIASKLAQLRRKERKLADVRYWENISGRLELKGMPFGKDLWVVLPHRGVAQLGGVANYSVRPERFIREKRKQSRQMPPALWSSDCGGTSIVRPTGEMPEPWMSIPMLSVPSETITTENQIGVRIVEYDPETGEFAFRTYNLKDLTMREREMIPVPEGLIDLRRQIFEQLKAFGVRTPGQLEDALEIARSTIEREIKSYNEQGHRPTIIYDERADRYIFDPVWMQRELKVPFPDFSKMQEDRVVGGACLHAGSAYTEYEFFLERVPKLIIETGATTLVWAGDIIQGLKHSLNLRGEVVPGFESYTHQEKLAGKLFATVAFRVFKEWFPPVAKKFRKRRPSREELKALVRTILIKIKYRKGNHDEWQVYDGHEPLEVFRQTLIDELTAQIAALLAERGWYMPELRDIVAEYVVEAEVFTLDSGLCLETFHPNKARTKASSQRPQECLEASRCQAVIEGNFHVAVFLEEWDAVHGQRPVLQVGTLVWMTKFEKGLLKKLDVGVGYLRLLSQDGRIYMTEVRFVGDSVKNPDRGPEETRQLFYKELQI